MSRSLLDRFLDYEEDLDNIIDVYDKLYDVAKTEEEIKCLNALYKRLTNILHDHWRDLYNYQAAAGEPDLL